MEQMTSICDMVGQYMQKKEEDMRITKDQAAKDRYWKIPICYDDDEDYTIAITPVSSTKEPVDSLIMEDEHLDTIPATESDEVIKSSVRTLSRSQVIPRVFPTVYVMCLFVTIIPLLKLSMITLMRLITIPTMILLSSMTFYEEHRYMSNASPPDAVIVKLRGGRDCYPGNNPAPSSDNLKLSALIWKRIVVAVPLPVLIISLLDYEAFYLDDDHIEEKSSGSTTTHADFSQYDSFIFDLSIDSFPPADRSNFYHEEFADELAHIISPPEYDCFCFKIEPELGEFTMDVVGDIFPTREPRVHVPNVLPTHPTFHLDLNFILSSDSLFAYVVWIFLAFLTYPVTPPYLLSCGNEDTIFDPGIPIYHSFMPGTSHRDGTFMCFNVYPNIDESPIEIFSSICFPMDNLIRGRDYPDFEDSRAHGFVHLFELHILSFI
ncbi:hypothetical protein Tco_0269661 [Tanacetum coccineum]